jgi:cell wall-associated NlpC family hydrolase
MKDKFSKELQELTQLKYPDKPWIDYFSIPENAQKFKEEALSWEGTPYHYRACMKGRGADCTSFVGGVFKNLNLISHYEVKYFPYDWWLHIHEQELIKYILEHKKHLREDLDLRLVDLNSEDLLVGDILTMSMVFSARDIANHTALYLGDNTIIHAITDDKIRISYLYDYFKKRIIGVVRFIKYLK